MSAKPTVTMDEANDGTLGVCLACGNVQNGCEPDARKYKCEDCGEMEVYGIEEAVMMGAVDVEDEGLDGMPGSENDLDDE